MSSLTSDPSFAQPLLGAATQQPITVSSTVTTGNTASGTSFPSGPTNGDEFIYIADATNGIRWAFQYNSGSPSAYKWEFIGGDPLLSAINTTEATNSTSYTALSTAGPSVALPLSGDWLVRIEVTCNSSPLATSWMSYDIGGTGAVDADALRNGASLTAAGWTQLKTSLTAVTLTAKYRVESGNNTFEKRVLSVLPVRTCG